MTNFVIIAGSNVATITIVTTDIADSVELLVRRKSVQIAADKNFSQPDHFWAISFNKRSVVLFDQKTAVFACY